MTKLLITTGLFLLGMYAVNAQKSSIENVQEVSLRNAGAIKEGKEIKGYYFFYQSDKIDKKTNEYTLRITDNNLKKLKDIKLQDYKDVTILNSSFNGSELMFVFHYLKEDKIEFQIYGADGNKKYTYEYALKNIMGGMGKIFKKASDVAEDFLKDDFYGELYTVNGKGFISKRLENGGKSISINFYSSKTRKEWSYSPSSGAKFYGGNYLGVLNKTLFFSMIKLSGPFDRNPESTLLGLDTETGKVIFEKTTYKEKYKLAPSTLESSTGTKPVIFGEYFNSDESIVKDKSKGFALWEVNETGDLVNEKLFSWETTFDKKLSIDSKGKIEDFGFLFVHDIVRLNDGNIFLIGEGYKAASSRTQTTDMMLIQIDKNSAIKDVRVFPKQSNVISLDGGGAFMSNQTKGYVIKSDNKFDYAYLVMNSDNSSFTVCYIDNVREKNFKGASFNSITYNEGKITTDKILIKQDATTTNVLPAKQGQVLILEYYKKEKRLDTHFEKLN